jgi:fructose-specific phosphotransferase system IIC component
MTHFTPWIRPTLLGPFITTWSLVTLTTLTFGARIATLGQYDHWLIAMLSASMFTGLIVCSLIAADVFLLQRKLRQLPTGASAWMTSMLAPVGVWFTWHVLGFGDGDIPSAVFHIAAPILLVPFPLRLLFGRAC